jgi:hypothetical protein
LQEEQLVLPWEETVPALQVMHRVCPTDEENIPAAQSWQFEGDVEPELVENVPALHKTHAVAPEEVEYEPAHSVHDAMPANEYVPASQDGHTDDPITLEYVPALQAIQLLLPATDMLLAGHRIQSEARVEPSLVEKLPALQRTQDDTPDMLEYEPWGQDRQLPPATDEYVPSAHLIQLNGDIAPSLEYVPALQAVHKAVPVLLAYEPAESIMKILHVGSINDTKSLIKERNDKWKQ